VERTPLHLNFYMSTCSAMVRASSTSIPKAVLFFRVYETALKEAGAIDFADMVPFVERAMAGNEGYRRSITGAFDNLLVDEYQDVNPGQIALIGHFVSDGLTFWAVGDDDQTL
jgi:DNA helicase-2/ATP-dependent DNA helicase PcrA